MLSLFPLIICFAIQYQTLQKHVLKQTLNIANVTQITDIDITENGQLVVLGTVEGKLIIIQWNVTSSNYGQVQRIFSAAFTTIYSVSVTNDKSTIIIGCDNKIMHYRKVSTSYSMYSSVSCSCDVRDVSINSELKIAYGLSTGYVNYATLMPGITDFQTQLINNPTTMRINSVFLLDDSVGLVALGGDKTHVHLCRYNNATDNYGNFWSDISASGPITSISMSADGIYLVTGSTDGYARIYENPTTIGAYSVLQVNISLGSAINKLQISANNSYICIGHSDTKFYIYKYNGSAFLADQIFTESSSPILSVAQSVNGGNLISGDRLGNVRFYFECSVTYCVNCTTPGICEQCDVGYTLQSNNTCQCLSPFVISNITGNCISCNITYCLDCQYDNTCSACDSGFTINNGVCECDPSKQINSNDICVLCNISYCMECSADLVCDSCPTNFILVNNTNVYSCNCTYPNTISLTNQCVPCINSHCLRCDAPSVCGQCDIGYSLNSSGSCITCNVPNCAGCENNDICESCMTNTIYVLINNTCIVCNIPHCDNCSIDNFCSNASYGFTIVNGSSMCLSPKKIIIQFGICVQCPNQCESCINDNICISCLNNFQLVGNLCQCRYEVNLYSQCIQCPTLCKQCIKDNICDECFQPMLLIDNNCIRYASGIDWYIIVIITTIILIIIFIVAISLHKYFKDQKRIYKHRQISNEKINRNKKQSKRFPQKL